MNMENMKAVFADEAFVKSLFALETADEVQAALKEKGVELTQEEILAVRDTLCKVEAGEITPEQLRQLEDGELTDEQLELVAGGDAIIASCVLAVLVIVAAVVGIVTEGRW